MSNRISNAVVLLAIVTATACRIERTPRVDAADPTNVARAEIELTLRSYEEALVQGDARAAAAVFTPGAHMYLPDTPDIMGRGEIDRTITNRLADAEILAMQMEYDAIEVDAGVAHQFGRFHQRLRDPAGDEQEVDGRFAIRWIRSADASWRIERMLLNHSSGDSTATADSSATADSTVASVVEPAR